MSEHRVRIENKKDNLLLRSAVLDDAEILTNWWNDGSVMAHAGFPKGLNQSIEQTKNQVRNNDTKLSQLCIIEAEGKRIGEASFGIGQGYAEIGIKLCEVEYQNRGLGTKLLQMLIGFLFEDDSINDRMYIERIILDTNLENVRAQHVYEKIGFTRVSVQYNSWKNQLGQLQSSVNYELTRAQYEDGVRWISDPDSKEAIAKDILYSLPEWFGMPDSTSSYIKESKKMPFWVYYKKGRYVGFIALKETGKHTAEIFVMGVLKEYHRMKIGEGLFEMFTKYAKNSGYKFMQVKTVDVGYYEEYDRTRAFYESIGFCKLECFPTLWDKWNPCLVMLQSVDEAIKSIEGKLAIELTEVNEANLKAVLSLSVAEEQKAFVPSAAEILARAWSHRNENAVVYAILAGKQEVGLALIYELEEEPACYYLMEMMIDKRYQNRGYGQKALKRIIEIYKESPRYPRMELSVHRENLIALHTYKQAGFVDLGYVNPNLPQYINLVYELK